MAKATWNGKVIAESGDYEEVDNNIYFPHDSVKWEFLEEHKGHHTTCHWKGEASYFHVKVDGKINEDAAWTYKEPSDAAKKIKGYVAFWRGVEFQK